MLTLLVIVLVVIGLFIYFRRLRQREIEEFMAADMSLLEAASGKEKDQTSGVEPQIRFHVEDAKKTQAKKLSDHESVKVEEGSLELSDELLDETHRLLYRSLMGVLGQQYYLAMNLPLSDIVKTRDPLVRNKIGSFRIGCLVCNKETFHPITGIYLDKAGLLESEESELIQDIFAKADIPLIRLPKDERYSPADLKQKLAEVLDEVADHKGCPKCGEEMALRLVTKGKNAGNTFWVCKNYPECKGVEKFSPLA